MRCGSAFQEISALLTPRAITVSPGPFPIIPPLTLAFAVMLGEGTGPVHYAYLKLPDDEPRFLEIGGGLLPIEELVRAELSEVYPDRSVRGAWLFRVTRLGDLDIDDARSGDLLQAMEEDLARRHENPIVRVEVESSMPPTVLKMLQRELRFRGRGRGGASASGAPEIQRVDGLLALSDVHEVADAAEARVRGFFPRSCAPTPRSDRPLGDTAGADRLVHHPYDASPATVRFISDAADSRRREPEADALPCRDRSRWWMPSNARHARARTSPCSSSSRHGSMRRACPLRQAARGGGSAGVYGLID